jgi:hypothetical protein
MFRRAAGSEAPDYIVAGEIVKTTRMYAMSVSPLPYRTLEKISPALIAGLGGKPGKDKTGGRTFRGNRDAPAGEAASGGRLKRARDFTSSIKIGSEIFEIETVKGKKQVKLPWEKLSHVKDHVSPETAAMYKGLRGIVIVNGRYTLLEGEKLELILSLAPSLKIDGALERKWTSKTRLDSASNLDELLGLLPSLVTPAIWKQGKKELGFICLFTDGEGNYWIRCSRGFHTGLNESLASVETLIDEMGDNVEAGKKRILNQTYRRLSDYLS